MSTHLTQHQLTEKFYELTMLFNLEMRSKNNSTLAYQGQGNILLALGQENQLSQKQLAERLKISAPSTTEFVTKLVNKGLVRKMKSPKDGRVSLISLTEKGRQNLTAMNQAELRGWDYLTDEQQAQFSQLLDVMIDGLHQEYGDQDHQAVLKQMKKDFVKRATDSESD